MLKKINFLQNITSRLQVKKNNLIICDELNRRSFPKTYIKHSSILVSIIVINRNGYQHLKVLLPALLNYTRDIKYELIFVDNASTDNSISYLESFAGDFLLQIIQNKTNESFSKANNRAVNIAKGKYLVLLNNDIEPLPGWLHFLLDSAQSIDNIGSVGARLVYPYVKPSLFRNPLRKHKNNSCTIQHAGIAFSDEMAVYRPYNIGKGKQADDPQILKSGPKSALTAACLLVPKDIYLEVGGLDEQYNYGGEDVDFGLKLLNAGYTNYYCADSVLFHHEFGTQGKEKRRDGAKRRQKNLEILQKKWFLSIKQAYWQEKIFAESNLYAETPLSIAIAVTDHGENVTAGDYFTAKELASVLEKYGWNIVFLSRKKGEWYRIPDEMDVLLSLLDSYDLGKIPDRSKRLITIAWPRNWFDRWCDAACFKNYDMVFSSSQLACEYIRQHSEQEPELLPIATNHKRFNSNPECINPKRFDCDICFTGSYWNTSRDIMDALSDEVLQKYRFHVYGANWEKFDKFKAFNQGFIAYEEIPCVYHHSKIVIDDANHVTKPFGSVNSRVFDALMSGTLVITNGVEGSKDLFAGELPYYKTSTELDKLLEYYLNDDKARVAKIKQLKEIIIKEHTYKHRAESIRDELAKRFLSKSIAIKIPAPTWERAYSWGDYHMAVLLKQQLQNIGFHVLLQVLSEWDNDEGMECDAVIVFRGLSRYKLKSHQVNIMWNISHPDIVSLEEYEEYDKVFIASELWADKIRKQVSVSVETMLQCTDPERFHPPTEKEKKKHHQQLLFVGNSRNIYRKILKDLMPTEYDLAVYGRRWEKIIPKKYIHGEHISNDELYLHYGSSDILLNDHWDDMREQGFVSNRIFDGLACGAFIITDKVNAMGGLEKYVQVYETQEELKKLISYYLDNPEKRFEKIDKSIDYISHNHTYKERAKTFSQTINQFIET